MFCSLCLENTSSLHDFCKLWPRGGFSRREVNTHSLQGFFQKHAAAYCHLMLHLVRVLLWFDSCFRHEHHDLGSTLQPSRAVVTSDHRWMGWERRRVSVPQQMRQKQRNEDSLDKGMLRQSACTGLSHLCHHWDEDSDKLWRPVASSREREVGRQYFKRKRCSHLLSGRAGLSA